MEEENEKKRYFDLDNDPMYCRLLHQITPGDE